MQATLSEIWFTSTGTPQGCAVSLCYIFHTGTDAAAGTLDTAIKFEADTAVVSLLKRAQVERGPVLKDLADWCQAHIQEQRTDLSFHRTCFTAHSIGSEERRVRWGRSTSVV